MKKKQEEGKDMDSRGDAEARRELPKGWKIPSLAEICDYNPKNILDPNTIVGFVPMNMVSEIILEPHGYEQVAWHEISKGYTHFQNGDVLLAKITPCFENGKKALVQNLPNNHGAGSTEYYVLRPKESRTTSRWIYFFISRTEIIADGKKHMSGAVGQQRIPKDWLLNLPIPLPPLPEQERIAARLDLLLGKLKAARKSLDGVPEIIKRFRKSVLAQAVSGRITEEWRTEHASELPSAEELAVALMQAHEDAGGHKIGNAAPPTEGAHFLNMEDFPGEWALVSMRDLVEPLRPITYGILKPGPEQDDGVPYIRVADFPGDQLKIEGIRKTTKEIDATFKRSRLMEGDILISIRGTYGRVVIVPKELEKANITQDTARLSIQKGVSNQYISNFLRSEIAQSCLQKAAKGVAVRGVNIGDIREMKVPLPSFPEQTEIVRRVDELFALADALEKRVAEARALAERLEPSILAKAFRGELSEQIPEEAAEWERKLAEIEARGEEMAKAIGKGRKGKKKERAEGVEILEAAEGGAGYGAVPRKRGRPAKAIEQGKPEVKRKRGRPRKGK